MARSDLGLEKMYANLVIDDEEEGGIIVPSEEVVATKPTYMLIGRFLTEKNINYNAMQNVMAGLWRPKEGMEVYDMGGMRYSFVFFHTLDMQKVLDGGPWSFEQAMLVLHQVKKGEDPLIVPLNQIDMWVQIYDIPRGFLSENILKSVGSSIGTYIKTDPSTFVGGWKQYVRIRVSLNITKPLKRRVKIKREGDGWSWLNFKFERLGTFCFVCGLIGHAERECNVVYAHPGKQVEKAYGTCLRAPNKNMKNNTGARWLRNAGEEDGNWGTSSMSDASVVHGGQREEEKFMEIDGVIRKVADDMEGIKVQARENREVFLHGRNNADMNHMEKAKQGENIVIDTKRKRVEITAPEGNNDQSLEEHVGNQALGEPTNLLMAGPGLQARQEL